MREDGTLTSSIKGYKSSDRRKEIAKRKRTVVKVIRKWGY